MISIIRVDTWEMLETCLRIRNDVFTVEKQVPKSIEVDEQDVLHSECDHFLIQYEGADVGAFRCRRLNGETVKLQRFCFLAAFRSKGIGRHAVEQMEAHYRARGIRRVAIDSKFEVFPFYEKCGYARVSDVFEEAGIPHVKMEKML